MDRAHRTGRRPRGLTVHPREAAADRSAELLARCRFPPAGSAVTCAVSGGADSMALLVLATEANCEVTAVHVDHGLRSGSADEADAVAAVAAQFGAHFRSERVDLELGPNLEARARAARYSVLPRDVLTGHTADDQAETMLLNLLRGAAVDGLAAMRPDRRPLLALRRAETATLCDALGLPVVDDPMNHDPQYARVRVRDEVLPLLNEVAGRDLVPLLCRQTRHLRDVADLLDQLSDALDPNDAKAVTAAPRALATVALRRWITAETGAEHPVDSAAIERVLAVAAGVNLAAEIPGGHRVARTAQRLRIEKASPSSYG